MSEPVNYKQYCKIVNKHGLHTRSAAAIVELASQYSCAITLATNKVVSDANDMIRLLLLEASLGTEVCVSASGEGAKQAVLALVELIEAGFNE
ncbi:MAG: HPr family phosphocarrier protein [Gammaproteobacteria bacterium]|nr:HPr family phosphocarrier protein [Gammaproteobacteria bacterium]